MSQNLLGNEVYAMYEYALTKSRFTPKFLRGFFKTNNAANVAGAINVVYGALTYDQVNREANAHSILRKENWEKSGFRVNNLDPATRLYGGSDGRAIGTTIDWATTTLVELSSIPGFVHTPFDMTSAAGFRAGHDDGLDLWALTMATMRDIHAQGLSRELLRSATVESSRMGANNSTDPKNDTNGSGVGIESIDRLISADAEEDNYAQAGTGHFDVYETQVDRDTATTYDAVVRRPDGAAISSTANQTWNITGLDTLIDDTEGNGADPASQVWLTGRDGRRALYDEMGSAGRWDFADVQAKLDYDGLSVTGTHSGRDISFNVRAYADRPIVVDRFVPSNGTTRGDTLTPTGRDGGTGKAHTYLIDQRHFHIKVGIPTVYLEVDNPVIRGQFDQRAIYWTCEQLYATRFNTSGKMRSAL